MALAVLQQAGGCALAPPLRRAVNKSTSNTRPVRMGVRAAAAEPQLNAGANKVVSTRRGPGDAMPDYTAIDAAPLNRAVMTLFRRKMARPLRPSSAASTNFAVVCHAIIQSSHVCNPRRIRTKPDDIVTAITIRASY